MANDDRDNDQLMELVSKIDDGQPIDWMSAELAAGTERERAVLAELRLLAALTQVSRNPDFHGAETLVEPITPPAGGFTQWGTLKVLELVGKGGFGRVYRAEDRLNRQVALKLFPLDRDGSGELVSRVLREGTLLARIKHPNVVVVHGVDLSGGYVGLWMEFVNGRTMEHELKARGTLSAEEATSIGVDVCRALAAVHGRGILHRDVKAQNVMREQGGRTVLMDFGAGSESVGDSSGPVDVAGTPLYLAPELFEKQPATRASDIYSLGVLLYRMVTWSYPVDGADRSEIAKAHREGRRQRLRDARPDLPHGFVEVVERALARDPAERYQTAATFEEALTRWDHHGRFRWLRTAGALAAAVILVLGAAWLVRSSSPPIESLPPSVVLPTPAAPAMAPYHVTAAFYRPGDQERTLAPGDRVAPGDSLGLRFDASTAVHVYVLNVDDSGDNYLLFPLPGGMTNPLAAGQTHELPGRQGANRVYWKVTSAAGREHFLVLASPTPVPAFEPLLRTLPSPTMGKPVMATPIPDSILGDLRGVGGLTSADGQKTPGSTRAWFGNVEPLRAGAETVRGLWIRQITLENPAR